jgi:hypothetical protein
MKLTCQIWSANFQAWLGSHTRYGCLTSITALQGRLREPVQGLAPYVARSFAAKLGGQLVYRPIDQSVCFELFLPS